jgi:hypothetical protein
MSRRIESSILASLSAKVVRERHQSDTITTLSTLRTSQLPFFSAALRRCNGEGTAFERHNHHRHVENGPDFLL